MFTFATTIQRAAFSNFHSLPLRRTHHPIRALADMSSVACFRSTPDSTLFPYVVPLEEPEADMHYYLGHLADLNKKTTNELRDFIPILEQNSKVSARESAQAHGAGAHRSCQ
jgi:hypothetical protein